MELQTLSSGGFWMVVRRSDDLIEHARAHCIIWTSILTVFANDLHRRAMVRGYGAGKPVALAAQTKRTWKAPTHGKFDVPALEFSVHCWSERCAGSFHCRCDCNGCIEAVTQEGAGV